jgi:RND family efflux transporter MFP subunit
VSVELDDADLVPIPVAVRVAPLVRRKTTAPLEVEGRSAASRAVVLKSPGSGVLEGPAFALGDVVKKADPIGSLGETSARQRALAAEASIHSHEAQLREREDALLAAQQRGEPADRVAGFELKVRAAKHKLDHEKVQRARHAILLQELRVLAPFDARISAVHLSPGAAVMAGNPLVELVDVNPIVLVVEVPTFAAARCPIGFEIAVEALGDPTPRIGRVSRWAPTAADDVRRLLIDLDNEDGRLAAGERGLARLELGERDAFFAPRAALHHEKAATHLSLVEHNRVLVRRVRTFGGDEREVEVAGRLEPTQLVVLDAERPVRDETEVVIRGDH